MRTGTSGTRKHNVCHVLCVAYPQEDVARNLIRTLQGKDNSSPLDLTPTGFDAANSKRKAAMSMEIFVPDLQVRATRGHTQRYLYLCVCISRRGVVFAQLCVVGCAYVPTFATWTRAVCSLDYCMLICIDVMPLPGLSRVSMCLCRTESHRVALSRSRVSAKICRLL